MGVAPIPGARFELTLPIAPPSLTLEQILDLARKQNPALEALRARQEQSNQQVTSARRSYLPSFSLSSGISGYTSRYTNTDQLITSGQAGTLSSQASCTRTETVYSRLGLPDRLSQCAQIVWSDAATQSIRDAQSKYPFNFSRNPYSIQASFSVPIFNGFRREQQVEQAVVQRKNADNDVRAQELKLVADVTSALLSLTTSQQTVALQEQNAATARLTLSLAQERYRVGAISLVDLVQARSDFDRAETDRITAVYDFHRAFAQLEAAVGRPLR
jgi:outer membrane protein